MKKKISTIVSPSRNEPAIHRRHLPAKPQHLPHRPKQNRQHDALTRQPIYPRQEQTRRRGSTLSPGHVSSQPAPPHLHEVVGVAFLVLFFLIVLPVFPQAVRHRRRDLLDALRFQVELVPNAPEVGSAGPLQLGKVEVGVRWERDTLEPTHSSERA